MSLQITQYRVGGFDDNCSYLVRDITQKTAAVVDPTGDMRTLFADLEAAELSVTAIWLTHSHFDHYDRAEAITERYGAVPIYVHEAGMKTVAEAVPNPVKPLTDDDALPVDADGPAVRVLHTPGHSADGVCFFYPATDDAAPQLISGDTLFVRGCGRTTPDAARTLYETLQRLKQLPGETVVYPGHDYGPTATSTLEEECNHNRFLRASDYESFYAERFSG